MVYPQYAFRWQWHTQREGQRQLKLWTIGYLLLKRIITTWMWGMPIRQGWPMWLPFWRYPLSKILCRTWNLYYKVRLMSPTIFLLHFFYTVVHCLQKGLASNVLPPITVKSPLWIEPSYLYNQCIESEKHFFLFYISLKFMSSIPNNIFHVLSYL